MRRSLLVAVVLAGLLAIPGTAMAYPKTSDSMVWEKPSPDIGFPSYNTTGLDLLDDGINIGIEDTYAKITFPQGTGDLNFTGFSTDEIRFNYYPAGENRLKIGLDGTWTGTGAEHVLQERVSGSWVTRDRAASASPIYLATTEKEGSGTYRIVQSSGGGGEEGDSDVILPPMGKEDEGNRNMILVSSGIAVILILVFVLYLVQE